MLQSKNYKMSPSLFSRTQLSRCPEQTAALHSAMLPAGFKT
jgi:hypothetical protein